MTQGSDLQLYRPKDGAAEDDSSQHIIGCLLLALGAALLWFATVSAPVSLYCLGGFGAGWALKKLNAEIEIEIALRKPASVGMRLMLAVLKDGTKLLTAFGMGAGAVWVVQLMLRLGTFDPGTAGAFQTGVYDFTDQLKQWTSLPVALGAVAFALALSLSINALWPLNALVRVRKWAGTMAGVLAAAVSFSFVGIQAHAGNYQARADQIRAELVFKLDELITARRNHAALQWLGASLAQQQPPSAEDARAAASLFAAAGQQCETADGAFQRGYSSVRGLYARPVLCAPDSYRAGMAAALEHVSAGEGERAPDTAWIPEFSALTVVTGGDAAGKSADASGLQHRYRLLAGIRRLADLKSLRDRIDAALRKAETARASVEGTVAELVKSQFSGVAAGLPSLVALWAKPLIGILAEESVARVSARLRLLHLPLPEAAYRLLNEGVEPVVIDQPAVQVRRAGSARAMLAAVWRKFLIANAMPPDVAPDSRVFERAGIRVGNEVQAKQAAKFRAIAVWAARIAEIRERARGWKPSESPPERPRIR